MQRTKLQLKKIAKVLGLYDVCAMDGDLVRAKVDIDFIKASGIHLRRICCKMGLM